jgi:Protein of unknown function DUF262
MPIGTGHARMLRLSELVGEIDQGRIALPNFQRDFDWSEADVRALLVTVLAGWPAGSLLLMEGEPTFFDVRNFEGGPDIVSNLRFVVLDGQQRLTALYQALFNAGSHVYALRLDALGSDASGADALEEAVVSFRRHSWDARYASPSEQWLGQLLPLSALVSPADYFSWRDQVIASMRADERESAGKRLSDLYRTLLSNIDAYEFPVVMIDSGLEPAGIARIFERVNRTGMRLNAFDLVVARVYERDWNLREQWEEARAESGLVDRFLGEDGMPVLQTMALAYHADVRQSAVLALPPRLVRERWEASLAAVNDALDFVVAECGVLEREWLPYRAMLLPLATIALDEDLADHSELLRKWFWSRSFSLAYDAAANTRVVADHKLLANAIEHGRTIRSPAASAAVLFEATRRRQAPIWRAFLCALAFRDARDMTGQQLGLGRARRQREGLPADAVVTPIYERGLGGEDGDPVHLRVLNLIIVSRSTARLVQRHGLAGAIDQTGDDGAARIEVALTSQFLPSRAELEELERDWQAFLDARLEQLGAFLREEARQSLEMEP